MGREGEFAKDDVTGVGRRGGAILDRGGSRSRFAALDGCSEMKAAPRRDQAGGRRKRDDGGKVEMRFQRGGDGGMVVSPSVG